MRVFPKSKSSLQAQVASFAYAAPSAEGSRAHWAIKNREDYYMSPEYVAYLRKLGSIGLKDIRKKAKLLDAYSIFATKTQTLLTSISEQLMYPEGPSLRDRSDFLGSGGFARVYKIEVNDESYAVRRTSLGPTFDFQITAGIRAQTIAHSEEIVAFSYDNEVSISRFVRGTPIHKLSSEELSGISDGHVKQLIDTVIQLGENGVVVDGNEGNFIYDKADGVTVIDFKPRNPLRIQAPPIEENLHETVLAFAGDHMSPNQLSERIISMSPIAF